LLGITALLIVVIFLLFTTYKIGEEFWELVRRRVREVWFGDEMEAYQSWKIGFRRK
jgi:hypothetical protein